jgi:hypothetical protein
MPRLCALLFAAALTGVAVAPIEAYGQDFGLWPPNPSPIESVGNALSYPGAVLTNPCFFGGCRYDPRDACVPGGACGGSWGGPTAAKEHSTVAAYRALSQIATAMAARGAVAEVSIDGGDAPRPIRHGKRARHGMGE